MQNNNVHCLYWRYLAIQNTKCYSICLSIDNPPPQSPTQVYCFGTGFAHIGKVWFPNYYFTSLPSFICCQTYCQQFKAALVVSACHHDIAQAWSLPTSIMGHERSPESERKTACQVELQLAVTVSLWFWKYLVVT